LCRWRWITAFCCFEHGGSIPAVVFRHRLWLWCWRDAPWACPSASRGHLDANESFASAQMKNAFGTRLVARCIVSRRSTQIYVSDASLRTLYERVDCLAHILSGPPGSDPGSMRLLRRASTTEASLQQSRPH
jgi:hypothetical protein